MKIIRSAQQMRRVAQRLKRQGKTLGFVPTMGALHAGHLSLVRRSVAENDVTVVSIFVNPLQFGPSEDFARYPRPRSQDLRLLRAAGADLVFLPQARELYPRGFRAFVEPGPLARRWEGRHRPGHFRGVATVVAVLLNLAQPTKAYFGQKDYQQALIIRRLIGDLRLPVRFRLLPTVREPDGLAMSSRNAFLDPSQRRQAVALFQALRAARRRLRAGERRSVALQRIIRRTVAAAPSARLEYAAIADADTLEPVARVRGRIALLVAARVGRTRLIDNLLVAV